VQNIHCYEIKIEEIKKQVFKLISLNSHSKEIGNFDILEDLILEEERNEDILLVF